MKFFYCEHCNNLITFVENKGVPIMCCGQNMTELIPAAVDAAVEKHVPVATINGNTVNVTVSTVEHPMVEAHYIAWVCIETSMGCQLKYLSPETKPSCNFVLAEGETLVHSYAYCNLHGLWES